MSLSLACYTPFLVLFCFLFFSPTSQFLQGSVNSAASNTDAPLNEREVRFPATITTTVNIVITANTPGTSQLNMVFFEHQRTAIKLSRHPWLLLWLLGSRVVPADPTHHLCCSALLGGQFADLLLCRKWSRYQKIRELDQRTPGLQQAAILRGLRNVVLVQFSSEVVGLRLRTLHMSASQAIGAADRLASTSHKSPLDE